MTVAIDTNVFAYAAGVVRSPDDRPKVGATIDLLERLDGRCDIIVPVQVLGELYNVLTRIGGRSREGAKATVDACRAAYTCAETSEDAFTAAVDLAAAHQLSIWDAIIFIVAAQAGCTLLLSEDLQPGFLWRGVTVVNPFAPEPDPRLVAVLA